MQQKHQDSQGYFEAYHLVPGTEKCPEIGLLDISRPEPDLRAMKRQNLGGYLNFGAQHEYNPQIAVVGLNTSHKGLRRLVGATLNCTREIADSWPFKS